MKKLLIVSKVICIIAAICSILSTFDVSIFSGRIVERISLIIVVVSLLVVVAIEFRNLLKGKI